MQTKKKLMTVLGKTELIKKINENLQKDLSYRKGPLTGIQIGKIIDKFLEETEKALIEGKQVILKGYFTLRTIETKARIGLNPAVISKLKDPRLPAVERAKLQSKKTINIPKGKRVSFKVSQSLKNKLNTKSGKK